MAMELYVLSDAQLPSMTAWQNAIDAQGYPVRLSGVIQLAGLDGAMPLEFAGEPIVVECRHRNSAQMADELAGADLGRGWQHGLCFRMAADIREIVAAYMMAAAYAQTTGGAVFDCEEGRLISPQRAAEIALELKAAAPTILAAARRAADAVAGPKRSP